MLQRDFHGRFVAGIVAAAAIVLGSHSQAFGHWHGSCGSSGGWYSSGGSSGGWYSSGGSSGGYYSSGGSSGGWHHAHVYYCCGSSGGWYSSGGSSGGWSSSGGSSGGWYSSTPVYTNGGVIMSSPAVPTPATPGVAIPPKPMPGPAIPPTDSSFEKIMSYGRTQNGTLTVNVPADAKVFVNGLPTTSTGTQRTYVSRNLTPGQTYTYEVRVEVVRNGQTVTDTKTIRLTAGQEYAAAFNLEQSAAGIAAQPAKTTLTLHVPLDAKVTLAGRETNTPGEVREFTTTKLVAGSKWDDYKIVVQVERNGRTVSQDKTISLTAGDVREMTFDFDSPQVAANEAEAK